MARPGSASTTGGFLAFIGWVITALGALGTILVMSRLSGTSDYAAPDLTDYILAIQSTLITTGVGVTAAAAGHLLARH